MATATARAGARPPALRCDSVAASLLLVGTVAGSATVQKSALEALYKYAGGKDWHTKTNWMDANKAVSHWHGVTTDPDSLVETLELEENNLRYPLPTELGLLDDMQTLALSKNFLTSSLPTELARLSKVQYFYFNENFLTSSIPSELALLSKVEILGLNSNGLTSSIPSELGLLTKVNTLSLEYNYFTSSIPSELTLLSSALAVYVNNNSLTSSVPSELGRLSKLEALNVSCNSFTSSLPSELGLLTKVTAAFELSSNVLTSSIPSELGLLTKATEGFNLASNLLTSSLPTELALLKSVEYLSLEANALTSFIPSELALFSNVKYLNLDTNSFTSAVPTELGACSDFLAIRLYSNFLTSSIPSELARLTKMEVLELYGNSLTSSVPTELARLINVKYLELSSNSLTSSIPSELIFLSAVEELGLSTNYLTSSVPSELAVLGKVQKFKLSYNSFTSSIPSELGLLTTALGFDVSVNSFSSAIPSELGLLSKTLKLYLGHNLFTSSIPTELGHLTDVRHFELYSNFLTSSIPSELTTLSTVAHFDLDVNSLVSSLPTELARLTNMKGLHLVSNSFSSSIPSELGFLSAHLQHLQLSSNKFDSSLPTELGQVSKLLNMFEDHNSLTASLPTELGSLTAVVNLLVHSNFLTSSIPTEFGRLTGLETLDLSTNKLRYAIPPQLGSVGGRLRVLILNENRLESTIPSTLCNMSGLALVTFSSNLFRGPLPVCPEGFPLLQGFDVSNNKFDGHLPSIRHTPRLEYLTLHKNRFSGTLRATDFNHTDRHGGGSKLRLLTLHNNMLSGDIPHDLVFPSTLNTLTLANNKFTGRLPRRFLEAVTEGSTMTLYLTNNRLSCDLPSWSFNSTRQSLVLIGNKFSWKPPGWVQPIEVQSQFLSTVVRTTSGDGILGIRFQPWLLHLIFACVVALLAAPLLVWYRRELASAESFSLMGRALLSCSYGVAGLGAFGLLFLVLFRLGANFYECGCEYMKYTTAAYVSDDPVIEWLLACGCIIWTGALCFVMRRFTRFKMIEREQHRDHQARTNTYAAANEDHWYVTIRRPRAMLWFMGWFLTLAVVGGVPTMIYVATYSLPDENVLDLKGSEGHLLGMALALYLSFVSDSLIPFVTNPTVRAVLATNTAESSKAERHEWESVLGIIARTLVVVVLPVISVLLLDNSCFSMWTDLWDPCRYHSEHYFERTESKQYQLNNQDAEVPEVMEYTLPILDNVAVCETRYQPGKCSRGVLEILYPLFTAKLICAVFIAASKPLTTPLVRRLFGKHKDVNEEPDPMRALIWYETAFIFGCLAPLMVVLVAIQLYADAIGFEWTLSRAPSTMMASWWGAEPLPIRPVVLKAHMVLVLFLQCVMVVFFFIDNLLSGWQMVATVVPAIFIGDLLLSVGKVLQRWQLRRRVSRNRVISNSGVNSKMPTGSSSSSEFHTESSIESPMHPSRFPMPLPEYLDGDGDGTGNGIGNGNEDKDEETL